MIQYREFIPSTISNFELHVKNNGKDTAREFRAFALREIQTYCRFLDKWTNAGEAGSTYVRVPYEGLTSSPGEVLSAVVGSFSPDEAVDQKRVTQILETMDRVTVAEGEKRQSTAVGVKTFRKVAEFRFYDEAFFRELEAQAEPFYQKMRAKPLIEAFPRDPEFDAVRAAEANQIIVDVSGHLQDAGKKPTGIPRIEHFIAHQASIDPDPDVRCVYVDSLTGLNEVALRADIDNLDVDVTMFDQDEFGQIWREINYRIRNNQSLNRNFDRYYARAVTNIYFARFSGQRAGGLLKTALYTYFKTYIRVKRNIFKPRGGFQATGRGQVDERLSVPGTMIMSNMCHSRALGETYQRLHVKKAAVFHDNIPLAHQEYVVSADIAQTLSDSARFFRKEDTLALCSSSFALEGVRAFDAEIGTVGYPVEKFPMPSILWEYANDKDMLSRIDAPTPFILYCSTVESRKNHILLARAWKLGLERGYKLPKLVCVGQKGWGVDELDAYLNENSQLKSYIEFTGPVTDDVLIDFYRSALFSVFPSFIEGWGMGASESLDFGLPVIISDADALTEATRGLMPRIASDDVEGWLEQIYYLASDAEALNRLKAVIAERYQPVTTHESWQIIKSHVRKHATAGRST